MCNAEEALIFFVSFLYQDKNEKKFVNNPEINIIEPY